MAYPYRIVLNEDQLAQLRGLVSFGIAPARMLTRTRILLTADHGEGGPGGSDMAIAGALDGSGQWHSALWEIGET